MFVSRKFQHVLTLTLVLFTAVICLFYSLVIIKAIEMTEDHIIENHIQNEYARIKHLIDSSATNQAAQAMHNPEQWLSHSGLMLTEGIQISSNRTGTQISAIDQLKPGVHELVDYSLHVLVGEFDSYQNNLILVYDEEAVSGIDRLEPFLIFVVVSVCLVIILLSMIVAYLISKKIAFPITNLTQQLSSGSPKLPFIEEQRQDEIGKLARTFSDLLSRINEFLDREKQFTRHASHELRTPLSIIKNSLGVLKLPLISEDKKLRSLERIEHSTEQISDLIETFLVLGREQSSKSKIQPLNLNQLIITSIDKFQTAQIKTKLLLESDIDVNANPALVSILLDNLIKNAMAFSYSHVAVSLDHSRIEISNDLHLDNAANKGHGFGQEIINRIADELGWKVETRPTPKMFSVSIAFQ